MSEAKGVDILLVEDSPGDVELTREGLRQAKILVNLHVVTDGRKALQYLRREDPYPEAVRPDLVLLDLNLPGVDGREVLRVMKNDEKLKAIPVTVLTTSEDQKDIAACYALGANCYATKPLDFRAFQKMVHALEEFWFSIVKVPPKER